MRYVLLVVRRLAHVINNPLTLLREDLIMVTTAKPAVLWSPNLISIFRDIEVGAALPSRALDIISLAIVLLLLANSFHTLALKAGP